MASKVGIGVIGGSGIYNIEGVEIIKEHSISTPFGMPSHPVVEAQIGEASFFFLARHGKGHTILPHEINFRANIYALKSLGVEYVISVSAVGSLKEELPPTTFVLPDQFIDWTKGKRERSFFGNGVVGHVSTAVPVELKLQAMIEKACKKLEINCSKGGSYICIEGPQFSSKAESNIYRSFDASVIGMTNVPEAYLAKEAGMAYSTVAMVTDYDCWKEEHCSIEEILKVMKVNNKAANSLLKELIPNLALNPFSFVRENQHAVMSDIELLNDEQKEMISVIQKIYTEIGE